VTSKPSIPRTPDEYILESIRISPLIGFIPLLYFKRKDKSRGRLKVENGKLKIESGGV
jgi:hypothetical protein